MSSEPFRLDAFLPAEMAERAEGVGVRKANMDILAMFALSVLAGAFIACGAIFATTAWAGGPTVTVNNATVPVLTYGVWRLLGGLVFCLGLILVVVAGAELFTGNNLIVMAWVNGKVSIGKLLLNWVVVYTGNFIGSIVTAGIMFFSKQYTLGSGALGITALSVANSKCGLGFIQAVALGIMCNALVCLAVWLCFSARSTTDKILSIIFPITAFVAAGFEHSIANMYFIPIGLFVKTDAAFLTKIGKTAADYATLTWGNFFLVNLLPVTIGNIIGGAGMVGLVYWFVYLRPKKR
jgi:formate/nitrite transporter